MVEESFENLAYSWEMFLVAHFHNMKKLHFGDYDSYIIMQVINSHFIYNKRKDYEKTNQNSWIQLFNLASSKYRKQILNEKNKLTVSSISRVTSIPLETVRRKIQKLCQKKVIETKNNSITLGEKHKELWETIGAVEAKILKSFLEEIKNNGGKNWLYSNEAKNIIDD